MLPGVPEPDNSPDPESSPTDDTSQVLSSLSVKLIVKPSAAAALLVPTEVKLSPVPLEPNDSANSALLKSALRNNVTPMASGSLFHNEPPTLSTATASWTPKNQPFERTSATLKPAATSHSTVNPSKTQAFA